MRRAHLADRLWRHDAHIGKYKIDESRRCRVIPRLRPVQIIAPIGGIPMVLMIEGPHDNIIVHFCRNPHPTALPVNPKMWRGDTKRNTMRFCD